MSGVSLGDNISAAISETIGSLWSFQFPVAIAEKAATPGARWGVGRESTQIFGNQHLSHLVPAKIQIQLYHQDFENAVVLIAGPVISMSSPFVEFVALIFLEGAVIEIPEPSARSWSRLLGSASTAARDTMGLVNVLSN